MVCVSEQFFEDGDHDMAIVQRIAQRNRLAMMGAMLSELGFSEIERFETIHNNIDTSAE